MGELTSNVSWLAVIVGAVLSFLLGWLWYSPMLFGTKWAEGSGVKMGSANQMPVEAMATQGLGLLLLSWFVAVSPVNVAALGTIALAVLAYSGSSFTGKSQFAKFVDAGYWIVSLIVLVVVERVIHGL